LQWLQDRLTHDHALIGGFIVAFLLAALMWFLWIAPELAMYFAAGLIRPSAGVLKAAARLRRMYSRM
jgi:hypothetical protein